MSNKSLKEFLETFDWTNVEPIFKYLAVDQSGHAYLYSSEPVPAKVTWEVSIHASMKYAGFKLGNNEPMWRVSLLKRPEGL